MAVPGRTIGNGRSQREFPGGALRIAPEKMATHGVIQPREGSVTIRQAKKHAVHVGGARVMPSLETARKLREILEQLTLLQTDEVTETREPETVARILELLSQASALCEKLMK